MQIKVQSTKTKRLIKKLVVVLVTSILITKTSEKTVILKRIFYIKYLVWF